MVDTGSEFLDLVLGLGFVYFLLSLICSGMAEVIAAVFRLRARKLEKGLNELLASDRGGLAEDLKRHPLVSRFAKGNRRTPSYLSARAFSLALLDTLAPRGSREGDLTQALSNKLDELPGPVRGQLRPLLDQAAGSTDQLRSAIETWYDEAMERVSGWYKRQSQLIITGIAVLVVVGLNVSTVRIVDRLWNDDTVRNGVAIAAAAAVADESKAEKQQTRRGGTRSETKAEGTSANAGDPLAEVKRTGKKVKRATEDLAALNLPVGWGEENRDWVSALGIGGWLLTILAVSLGAPFWFDALSRLAPLRSTGPRPKS
jgi:hypothetical protein